MGVYPLGDGQYGYCDLVGNVLEWCQTEEELPDIEGVPWKKGDR